VRRGNFDFDAFRQDVHTCVRFLDDVLDVNVFALEDNRTASQNLRRLGLGVMGLADMLIKLGLRYDSQEGREFVEIVMMTLREEAVRASEDLGRQRGVYPVYAEVNDFGRSDDAPSIPHEPRRNVAVLTVAPTGTTSMLFGVSSGIEPVFSPFIWRKIGAEYVSILHPLFVEMMQAYPAHPDFERRPELREVAQTETHTIYRSSRPVDEWDWDKVSAAIGANHGSLQGLEWVPQEIRDVFVCAHDISPEDHVRMQGVVQTAFDEGGDLAANSLSKTINLPNEATVEDVKRAYELAYETGCKGITVYRDGSRQWQPLSSSKTEEKNEKLDEAAARLEEIIAGEPSKDDGAELRARLAELDAMTLELAGRVAKLAEEPQKLVPAYPLVRPERLQSTTDMVKMTKMTPDGMEKHSYLVTVGHGPQGPMEVILTGGKAGDESNADAEALGRVVSIALQYGVPVDALVKTLRGIQGGLAGYYAHRHVASKADLIAVGLEQAMEDLREASLPSPEVVQANITQAKAMHEAMFGQPKKDTCPHCGSELVRQAGCLECKVCGSYSKCG